MAQLLWYLTYCIFSKNWQTFFCKSFSICLLQESILWKTIGPKKGWFVLDCFLVRYINLCRKTLPCNLRYITTDKDFKMNFVFSGHFYRIGSSSLAFFAFSYFFHWGAISFMKMANTTQREVGVVKTSRKLCFHFLVNVIHNTFSGSTSSSVFPKLCSALHKF